MIITKPGFYASKNGRCEVVWCNNSYGFGFLQDYSPAIWSVDGTMLHRLTDGDVDITGAWVEPSQREELWMIRHPSGEGVLYWNEKEAMKAAECLRQRGARLVHLREVKDAQP